MGFMEIFIKSDAPEEEKVVVESKTIITPIHNEPPSAPEMSEMKLNPASPEVTNLTPTIVLDESGMIKQVYETAGLGDLSKSIFKIQQIRTSFPETIPDEVVRQTIPGLLTAANLDTVELRLDAETRIATLNTALQNNLMEQTEKINSLTEEINELAMVIEAKRQEIINAQQNKDIFSKVVEQETKVIQENLTYLS